MKNKNIALTSIFTALVIVLQMMGSFIRLGQFSISLTLVPIVVGECILGPLVGAWLGFVFGMVVLLSGDAAFFISFSFVTTILVVLLKGTLAGFVSGVIYKTLHNKNQLVATILASIACPLVNTGIFIIACLTFYNNGLGELAGSSSFTNLLSFVLIYMVGGNFIFELLINALLSPTILKVINMYKKR